ncbi:MAG: VanZ family protein [Gemmatimonadaceae bacterium]|jgi:glycopeptide antibiotics resistance protein
MLRHLLYPFLVYRSILWPFFVVSSIAVPCWLVFRFYRLRALRQPLSFRREMLLLIFVLYLSGLAAATLTPNHGSIATTGVELRPNLASLTCSSPSLPTGSRARFFCMYNAKGNVLLFIPLGFLLPLAWPRLRFWKAIEIAIAVSVSIEVLQYVSRAWGSYRLADVNDVVLNTLGTTLGLILVSLLRLGAPSLVRRRQPRRSR